ncbi:hypothetical protein GY45DRAFT_1153072 [Cubamyces sp. BRFM 1775]|nr:hypothetical protein GY45DRAFT_1153072 [Cubamyces sp. BRFM 1775]
MSENVPSATTSVLPLPISDSHILSCRRRCAPSFSPALPPPMVWLHLLFGLEFSSSAHVLAMLGLDLRTRAFARLSEVWNVELEGGYRWGPFPSSGMFLECAPSPPSILVIVEVCSLYVYLHAKQLQLARYTFRNARRSVFGQASLVAGANSCAFEARGLGKNSAVIVTPVTGCMRYPNRGERFLSLMNHTARQRLGRGTRLD